MDRRRFVPSPEGLEGRELMSGLFGTNSQVLNNPDADIPVTFTQKTLRVEHLPYYLGQLQHGRFLSVPGLEKLQADLTDVITKLNKPDYHFLLKFNSDMRHIVPKTSLSAADSATLNRDFTRAVAAAGATAEQTANLGDDMNALAKIDSQSRDPVFLATNDYAVVLQTILGIGRKIQTPLTPLLAEKDGQRVNSNLAATRLEHPKLVGQYGVGDTVGPYAGSPSGGFNSAGDIIQIVDDQGNVLGQGEVDKKTGNYAVTVENALPPGVYDLHVRAVDPEGHISPPSELYRVKVFPKRERSVVAGMATPQGPLSKG